MATQDASVRAEIISDLSQVPKDEWNACTNVSNPLPDPFNTYDFLQSLEESGSATPDTGWAPQHVIIRDCDGAIAAAMPMYLKSHSQGEYVFDHSWADAFYRAGGEYYPKLQVSIPFTPATGRRLLVRKDEPTQLRESQLIAASVELASRMEVSSIHYTFVTKDEWDHLGGIGLLQRTDQQFHWSNKGYGSFDEFLDDLSSRKRKNLRKERNAALENDIEIEWLTGSDLKEHHWDHFFEFYMDTGSRKWGRPYLTRTFFSLINERMRDQTLLVMCKRNGRYIAGALNFFGNGTLFGRYWGCVEDHRFLHFETCYYQAIDFAIARGLNRVEAGAQGTHKLARGYEPTHTYSAHYIADSRFRDAVAHYLESERSHVDEYISELSGHTPFRKASEET